jgi:hypothetical protein
MFGDILIGVVIGIVLYIFLGPILEGTGSVAIRGSKKHGKYSRDADAKVKDILKNGTGSSKAELQEWWDTYHPPK